MVCSVSRDLVSTSEGTLQKFSRHTIGRVSCIARTPLLFGALVVESIVKPIFKLLFLSWNIGLFYKPWGWQGVKVGWKFITPAYAKKLGRSLMWSIYAPPREAEQKKDGYVSFGRGNLSIVFCLSFLGAFGVTVSILSMAVQY